MKSIIAIPNEMELKKIKVPNSRYFYIPHHGKLNEWFITLGKVLNKMEKDTPFISASSFCEIFVLGATSILVGKDVIGPIRADVSGIFIEDFKKGEVEGVEIFNTNITFPEIMEKAQEIIAKRPDLRSIFSIRINQKDPILNNMGLRFFSKSYPFPKLTN